MLVGGCTQPSPPIPSPSRPTPSPSLVAQCRLPVVWNVGTVPHHAFLSYPSGDVAEVDANGDVYDAQYQRWVPGTQELVSPDGSQYTYFSFSSTTPGNGQVHVVDVVSGVDRFIYDGATIYWPIAFAGDGIYVTHAINLKQNAFEGLFRLDPVGGTPARVRGDLGKQAGWTLVSGGSAWGVLYGISNQQVQYTVEQLNLTTGTTTDWLQEPPNLLLSPVGRDAQGRLYISDNYELWRLDGPNVEERLLHPPPIAGQATFYIFAADPHGEWIGAYGGPWHYSDAEGARQLAIATNHEMVVPAGPCT